MATASEDQKPVALVTGGARGLGVEVCRQLAQAGMQVWCAARTPAYSTSKLALNGLTRMLADELRSDGVLVNVVCPGWTATDMGGGGRPVPAGARSITWACLLPDDGPTGGFFRDGQPLPW